jgi:hypothetical protein
MSQAKLNGKTIEKIHVWWDTDSGRDDEGWAIHVYGPDDSEISSQGIDAEPETSLDDVIDRGLWEVGIEGMTHDDFACTKDNGGFAIWEPSDE